MSRKDGKADVVVAENKTHMAKLIRELLVKSIEQSKSHVTVGLSGGSMVSVMSPVLSELDRAQADKLRLFCVDERLVPLADADSNTGAYLKKLADEFREKFVPLTDCADAQKAAREFESKLKAFDVEETHDGHPIFDFLFLGLGPDGHTCSLFPGHELLEYRGQAWVLPIEDSPKPPPRRITITIPVCNAAKQVVFIATGAGKADLIKQLLVDNNETLPAGKVQPTRNKAKWFLDADSAQQLNI